MNRQELQEAIDFLFEPDAVIGLELYLVLDTDDGIQIRKADLGDGNLPNEVKNGFISYLNGRTVQNDNAQVLPLSELNPDRATIHHYDFEDLPDGLDIINTELNPEKIDIFNFDNDSLDDVDSFLIKLSSVDSNVVLYKKHSHLNLLKQSRVFYFVKDDERFAKPKEGILRFSFSIDFMKVGDEVFVYDIKCLEREFAFDDIIINNAQQRVISITQLNFVDNIAELTALAVDKSGARKVLSIKQNSPVLQLQFDQIKTFVKNHPYLRRRLKFNNDESRFHFHTQVSRIYFIDLLNDNFLTSDLTSIFYKTNLKDEMAAEAGEDDEEQDG